MKKGQLGSCDNKVGCGNACLGTFANYWAYLTEDFRKEAASSRWCGRLLRPPATLLGCKHQQKIQFSLVILLSQRAFSQRTATLIGLHQQQRTMPYLNILKLI
jgi:hypothetical protein